MKTTTTSTCSQTQHILQRLPDMTMEINIAQNPLNLSMDDLFIMATRVNKKRGFLFVSKLLGKHLPLNPTKALIASGLLAMEYVEQVAGVNMKEKDAILRGCFSEDPVEIREAYNLLSHRNLRLDHNPLIIGFAETATSLGHAFFDCIDGAVYIHTTREEIQGHVPLLNFKEEHSHAVNQLCYIEEQDIDNQKPVVLVDDELTTGKTATNIIRNIHSRFPREQYAVISILDWRSPEDRERFRELEKELGITILTVSLMSGNICFSGETIAEASYDYSPKQRSSELNVETINLSHFFTPTQYTNEKDAIPYIQETGRFGLISDQKRDVADACVKAAGYLEQCRKGRKTLCLGTGEFMYLPMKIASLMGDGVFYHSTTRSPILPQEHEGYAIQNGFSFMNPEDDEVVHYVYNIPEGEYDELFLFFEKELPEDRLQEWKRIARDRGIRNVNIVGFSRGERRDGDATND